MRIVAQGAVEFSLGVFIQRFKLHYFVIKYGGSILEDSTIRRYVLEDIVFLSYVGIRTILVHGGGPHISKRLNELGIKAEFHDGIRITNDHTLKVVSEEFDKLNLNQYSGNAKTAELL